MAFFWHQPEALITLKLSFSESTGHLEEGMNLLKSSMLKVAKNWLQMVIFGSTYGIIALQAPKYQLSWSMAFPQPSQAKDNKEFRRMTLMPEQSDQWPLKYRNPQF